MENILQLRHKARELYPQGLHYQKQWVRKHFELMKTGRHVLAPGSSVRWSDVNVRRAA
jgi:hypothetical protein